MTPPTPSLSRGPRRDPRPDPVDARVPITVLGGYLGAGKTTLLNRALHGADRRLGVIVNDFGELGVDAALLDAAAGGDGLVDLPNGCVCCTLGTALGDALGALAARRPAIEHIVIEASGVADPAALAAWGTTPGFEAGGVIVLAAADTIERDVQDRYVGGEVRRQLAAADVVLVTKTDLVPPVALDSLLGSLRTTTSVPVVPGPVPTDSDRAVADLLLAPAYGDAADRTSAPVTGSGRHDERYARWAWSPDPGAPVPAADAVRRFTAALPPQVVQAKGVVGDVLIQVVGASRTVGPAPSSARPIDGVVAIGLAEHLDAATLDALADHHFT